MANRSGEHKPIIENSAGEAEKSDKKVGRPVSEEGPKHNVLSIRGTSEWRAWLGRLSDHCRLKSADVVDRALIVYAKQEGFTEPPPKR